MSQWYYAQDSQQLGPVNEAELKEHLATGKLPPTVLVWKEGMENWAMANSLPEFQFRPPPSPSAPRMAPIPFATAPAPAPTPAPAAAPAPTPAPEAATPAPAAAEATGEPPVMDPEDVKQNKPIALLSYLGILFIIPMLAAKESPFAKYHANQGLILFIATLVYWVAMAIIAAIPFVNLICIVLVPLSWAVWLVFAIIGILNAAKGECKPLPYIGQYTIYT